MKISLIGHASLFIEVGGITVLSDPWWKGPCFGAQWWIYPKPRTDLLDGRAIDFIYVSHGHHDHFHPGTLNSLPKTAKVLVSSTNDLAAPIRELGFDVIEVSPDRPSALNEKVTCRIVPTYGDDTMMTLNDGAEVCVNANDALHSAPAAVQDRAAAWLRATHTSIDYLFCGYGIASHFPNCYVLPGKDAEATTAHRQRHFNREWVRVVEKVAPVYAFPFAADVVFLDRDLFWVNEVTHNAERPTDVFRSMHPTSRTLVLDPAPGFTIENGQVTADVQRQPISSDRLRAEYVSEIVRANQHGTVSVEDVDQLATLLAQNLDACRPYLASGRHDYRVLIRFHNSANGLLFEKAGMDLRLCAVPLDKAPACDLVYTTRLAYLRWALTREYGHELLFVGSGGIFEYPEGDAVRKDVHQEVISLVRKTKASPRVYPNPLIKAAKRLVKKAIGRNDPVDLYDLTAWTAMRQR